jgi:hypothetical protein
MPVSILDRREILLCPPALEAPSLIDYLTAKASLALEAHFSMTSLLAIFIRT